MAASLFHGSDTDQLNYWLEEVGWSLWTAESAAWWERSIHGVSLSDFWATSNLSQLEHWDGSAWTLYDLLDWGGVAAGCACVHTVGENAVWVGTANTDGSFLGSLYRFNGIIFDRVWTAPFVGFSSNNVYPWTIDQDSCYFVVVESHNPPLWRWTGGAGGNATQHPAAMGLPLGIADGIAVLDGEIFVVYETGDVYRGTWGGTWVLDNPTDGPFPGIPGGANGFSNYMALSADGLKVCVHTPSVLGFWVRDGFDNWSNRGPTVIIGGGGELAMANDQILLAGGTNNGALSTDGGLTWTLTPNLIGGGWGGAWAFSPSQEEGGDLAGGPRFRVGFDPERRSGPRQEDGSLQSDLQFVTGVQNIAQFDGGTLED